MKSRIIAMLCLITIEAASASHNLIGIYDLYVQIGEQKFHDILRLYRFYPNRVGTQSVAGEFEVPGVFKVPFTGVYDETLEGSFIAKESGKEFRVELYANFSGACNVSGHLSQKSQIFGEFNGKMRGCNE